MTSEKDRVREELINHLWQIEKDFCISSLKLKRIEAVADFILADRKRIVEPLVKLGNMSFSNLTSIKKSVIKTLSNAGIERTENG